VVGGGVVLAGGLLLFNAYCKSWFVESSTPERDLAAEARADLERRAFRPLSGPLETLLSDPTYQPVPTQAHPLLGQPAPDFTLPDAHDKPWKLSQALGDGPVVLVFYYGYYCNHCVSQLFALDKDLEKFHEMGAQIVAISSDSTELTRKRFQEYGPFAFPVLSDRDNKVAEKYGTYAADPKGGEANRMHGTFVIDRRGHVVWTNRGDSPFTENRTLLLELRRSERASSRRE
jgi:peroxiredoxin